MKSGMTLVEMEANARGGGGQKRFWLRLRSLGGSSRGRGEVVRRVKDEDRMIIGKGSLWWIDGRAILLV